MLIILLVIFHIQETKLHLLQSPVSRIFHFHQHALILPFDFWFLIFQHICINVKSTYRFLFVVLNLCLVHVFLRSSSARTRKLSFNLSFAYTNIFALT